MTTDPVAKPIRARPAQLHRTATTPRTHQQFLTFDREQPKHRETVDPNVLARQSAVLRQPESSPTSTRVLVLDDDRLIGELIGEMLTLLGHVPTLCHFPADALERVARENFDVVISDFRMPGMDGREFYQQAIRSKPELARRIVFLTGDVVNDDTQEFLRSTGNPHLSKPFQLARVEQVVAEVLRQNRISC
jgi:CheY-like chemotaxis protein